MIRWFRERGIHVGHAWGMTETSPIGTCGTPPARWDEMSDEEQVDYIAQPGPVPFNVELRIVDDDGNALPRDGVLGPAAGAGRGSSSATSRPTRTRPTKTSGSTRATSRCSIPTG